MDRPLAPLAPDVLAQRLARLSELCLALPEVASERHGEHVALQVPATAPKPKNFAYYLHDHHGDGKVALSVRLPRGANAALVDADPARFYLPTRRRACAAAGKPGTAHRGWLALRLDLPTVDWDEFAEAADRAAPRRCARIAARKQGALQAPRRLAALVAASAPAR